DSARISRFAFAQAATPDRTFRLSGREYVHECSAAAARTFAIRRGLRATTTSVGYPRDDPRRRRWQNASWLNLLRRWPLAARLPGLTPAPLWGACRGFGTCVFLARAGSGL